MLLLLALMTWVLVSQAGAYEGASGLAEPVMVTVQATPTANPTVATETANEQLRKLQRDNDRSWPNTNIGAMKGKIVIYSWSLFARGEKSGKRCICLDAEGWDKPLQHYCVTFSREDEEASTTFFATTVQFLPFFPLLLVYIAEI